MPMITAYTLWVVGPAAARHGEARWLVREAALRRFSPQDLREGPDGSRGAQDPARRPGQVYRPDLRRRLLDDADVEPDFDIRRADAAHRKPDPRRARGRYLGHGSSSRV